jgi:hypothetical protein
MTRTFTVAIMAAIMFVHYRDAGDPNGFIECAEAAKKLYDYVQG